MAWVSLRTWVTGEFELAPFQVEALNDLMQFMLVQGVRVGVLMGPRGVGKSTVAGYFAQHNRQFFAGGAEAVLASDDLRPALRQLRGGGPSLLVIDEAHTIPEDDLRGKVERATQTDAGLHVLALSQAREPLLIGSGAALVGMWGFSPRDVATALHLDVDEQTLSRFHEWLSGRPPTYAELADAISAGVLDPARLGPTDLIDEATVLGADGRPVAEAVDAAAIAVEVREAAKRLYNLVREQPDLLRALDSREFEEVVAEHLIRRGFNVQLTAQSRDGGKDIYAARQDELGSFLYVVECKAFAPDQRVGVGLVRRLYGVAQHERATAGILATTSYFTGPALTFQEQVQYQLSLRDFDHLKSWLAR